MFGKKAQEISRSFLAIAIIIIVVVILVVLLYSQIKAGGLEAVGGLGERIAQWWK